MTAPILSSRLQCPACGHADLLDMPTDACLFFHRCVACGEMLRPKAGDCCVFCSYGTVPCPPVQARGQAGDHAGRGPACCDRVPVGETPA